MKTNLFVGNEAQAKLIAGLDKAVDAVKTTLGAKGTNAILEAHEYPFATTTNDGISILERIQLEDPLEQMGVNLVKETSGRHNKSAGDGSTTTAVLLQAIVHEGAKCSESPLEIKRSLEECLPLIEASIDAQKKEITVDDVGKVAAISAEDEKIGALIQEIYQKIGKDGILYPDISKTFEDHYTLGNGIKIDSAGFASPYMADTDENGRMLNVAQFKNPQILLAKQKITSARGDLERIVSMLASENKKELVIFYDEVEPPVIVELVMTRAKSGFKTVLIKMPVLWKDWWYEDLAKLTGAKIVDLAAGLTFKGLKTSDLGTCGNLVVDKNDTFIDGGNDVSDYIKTLEEEGTEDGKIRAARLNTKTARLFVGAHSDQALSYKRLKVEDARNASYLALQDGVVAGGGVALLNASRGLPESVGGKILKKALQSPMRQIMENAGHKPTWAEDADRPFMGFDNLNQNLGFNAKTGEIGVDMFEAGILDPAMVVKSSIRNAISVAGTFLTAKVVITLPKVEEKQVDPRMPVL